MDPDANLEEQREVTADIMKIRDAADPYTGEFTEDQELELVTHAERLAELAQALDEWISKGGFLPKPWKASR